MIEDLSGYVSNPQLLIDLIGSVIDELTDINQGKELQDKKVQLFEINKAIKSLETKQVYVPDSFRNEKVKLVNEISNMSSTPKLQIIQNGLEELLKSISADDKSTVKAKRVRSKEPRTDNGTLREILIEVLKKMGGKGQVKEIRLAMEELLQGKLLPGDLVLREDGRTIAWFNNVQWERMRMVEAGLLKNDSPTGYWELIGDDL